MNRVLNERDEKLSLEKGYLFPDDIVIGYKTEEFGIN